MIVIEYDIRLRHDSEGILTEDTVVNIFDKRLVILGIKRLRQEFKNKRRKMLMDSKDKEYRENVLIWNRAIESKLEENLRFIMQKLRLSID